MSDTNNTQSATTNGHSHPRKAQVVGPPLENVFAPAMTLVDILLQAANPTNQSTVRYVGAKGNSDEHTYADLLEESERISEGLNQTDSARGSYVILQLENPRDFIPAFWASQLSGFVPVPLAVPLIYSSSDATAERLRVVFEKLGHPRIVTDQQHEKPLLDWLSGVTKDPPLVIKIDDLRQNNRRSSKHEVEPDDLALMLFTSGSTGDPKGVMLTHRNLLSMASGTVAQQGFSRADVVVNWLPLDHIGAISFLHILPTALGCSQIQVATNYVLGDVTRWLDLINRYRGSISWAPDFAFRLITHSSDNFESRGWELSCLRFLVNAGENVSALIARQFIDRLAPFHFPAKGLRPAFGMSETASGITWAKEVYVVKSPDDRDLVMLGPPIPGAAIRIVDKEDRVVDEGSIGDLQLFGPSVIRAYFNNPRANEESFTIDGWFKTGDRGIIIDGQLAIVGRENQVVILNGRHLHQRDIEVEVESVAGVIPGSAIALPARKPSDDREQLIILFSTQSKDTDGVTRLIRRRVLERFRTNPDVVMAVSRDDLPRTSIGKVDKSALRKKIESGSFKLDSGAIQEERSSRSRSSTGSNELATSIRRIWREVLGNESALWEDNFFDAGGSSLLLVQLEQRLQVEFNIDVNAAELFSHGTISEMVSLVAGKLGQVDTRYSHVMSQKYDDDIVRRGGDVAIIGMACRFPGAPDIESYWQLLAEGRESIRQFTPAELKSAGIDPHIQADPHFVPASPFLENIDQFDAAFFGYSDRDAAMLDPQHRLFLQCVWHALENAGYDPQAGNLKIGVFASCGLNTYMQRVGIVPDLTNNFEPSLFAGSGDFLSTRCSYKLNLRGPSINVQSACSSSLVALHLALQSLRNGECELAVVGASSLWMLDSLGYRYTPGGLMSNDGHCRVFDAAANGMVFGNGTAAIVIRSLDTANQEGDTVHAILKATAVNNDGSMKAGFAATGFSGQVSVIQEAWEKAGIAAESVSYIECHGTGTPLGDALEVAALSEVFRKQTKREKFCAIGSAKANIGHMGVACGMAGLIKTVLSLKHQQIPAVPTFNTPNPQIKFEKSPFFVPTELCSSPNGSMNYAGVSSFGLGGTNTHAVLERAQEAVSSPSRRQAQLIIWSARTPEALSAATVQLKSFLERSTSLELADVAYTLQVGRRHFRYRRWIVCHSVQNAVSQLSRMLGSGEVSKPTESSPPSLVWLTLLQTSSIRPDAVPLLEEESVRTAFDQYASDFFAAYQEDLHAVVRQDASTTARTNLERSWLIGAANLGLALGAAKLFASWGVNITKCFGDDLAPLMEEQIAGQRNLTRIWERLHDLLNNDGSIGKPEIPSPDVLSIPLEFSSTNSQRPFGTTQVGLDGALGWLGIVWASGRTVDWDQLHVDEDRRRLPLPGYPFANTSYWIGEMKSRGIGLPSKAISKVGTEDSDKAIDIDKPQKDDSSTLCQSLSRLHPRQRRTLLIERIQDIVCDLLKMEQISADHRAMGFLDLGLTSQDAVSLIMILEKELGSDLPHTLLFEHPNIDALAEYLSANIDFESGSLSS